MHYLAVDIGGTSIKSGIVSADGVVLFEQSTPTLADEGLQAVMERLRGIVRGLRQRMPTAEALGIGVPGVVDPVSRVVQAPPNLPGWDRVDILSELRAVVPFPLAVENDANAAALGEAQFGAGRTHENFLYATLGTGIGGGVILGSKLYTGPHGDAGEIGHIIMNAWATEGATDTRAFRTGVLEDYAGIKGILRMAREEGEDVANVNRIQNNAVLREVGRIIGLGLCSACAVLGLRTVIVGGGIAQAPFVLDAIRTTMLRRAIPTIAGDLAVLPAQFGAQAGLIGAAAVARTAVRG